MAPKKIHWGARVKPIANEFTTYEETVYYPLDSSER